MKIQFFKGEIIRRSSIVFLATFLASIISLIANLIILNLIGIQSFGNFKTVIYLFAFLPFLVDLGTNASLTKYIAEFGIRRIKETRYLIRWFLKLKAISCILLIALIFLLKSYISLYFLKDPSLDFLVIAGILLTTFNFFTTFNFIILGFQNFKLFSLSQFLNPALSAFLAIMLSRFGVFYAIIGWSLGPLLGNLPNILFLFKKGVFGNYKKIDINKIFFNFSLPVYPIELSTSFFNVIIPVLSLFFSQLLIGYYSFAFMFYLAALLIPNSLSIVLFPKVSELNGLKNYREAKNILRKCFLYYSFILILGLLFVFLFSEQFILWVSKESLPSLLMFKILVFLGLMFGYNTIYTNYLKGLGKIRKFALLTLLQNFFLIIISFILMSNA